MDRFDRPGTGRGATLVRDGGVYVLATYRVFAQRSRRLPLLFAGVFFGRAVMSFVVRR